MDRNRERTENRCGVRDFAQAMQDKLDRKMMEGRGGWYDPKQCSIEELCVMLSDHIGKGDPVDIGNFAMMIWNRKRTAATQESPNHVLSEQSGQDNPAPDAALTLEELDDVCEDFELCGGHETGSYKRLKARWRELTDPYGIGVVKKAEDF